MTVFDERFRKFSLSDRPFRPLLDKKSRSKNSLFKNQRVKNSAERTHSTIHLTESSFIDD